MYNSDIKVTMIRKKYIHPQLVVVKLSCRAAMLQSVSGAASLDGTSYGGDSSDAGSISADVKEIGNNNIWNEEW